MPNNQAARRRRARLGVIGLALAAAAATPALAADQVEVVARSARAVTVSIGDLNLASATGMSQAERRIAFAARDVCVSTEIYSLQQSTDYLNCRADAIKTARLELDQRLASNSRAALRVSAD
jgi:UrcA family protein